MKEMLKMSNAEKRQISLLLTLFSLKKRILFAEPHSWLVFFSFWVLFLSCCTSSLNKTRHLPWSCNSGTGVRHSAPPATAAAAYLSRDVRRMQHACALFSRCFMIIFSFQNGGHFVDMDMQILLAFKLFLMSGNRLLPAWNLSHCVLSVFVSFLIFVLRVYESNLFSLIRCDGQISAGHFHFKFAHPCGEKNVTFYLFLLVRTHNPVLFWCEM